LLLLLLLSFSSDAPGQQCVKGIQMACKRLKGKGAWEPCHINLALDVLFIYKDKSVRRPLGYFYISFVEKLLLFFLSFFSSFFH
jgi:hypothetical protein